MIAMAIILTITRWETLHLIALGASTFAAFYLPHSHVARSRNSTLSNKKFPSFRWEMNCIKYFVALAHEKVKNQRKDWLEKTSKDIADNFDVVCIEDLNMQAMSQCFNFGKSISDLGWGMFVSMLKRKVKQLITIDKWFPSSKKCNYCGHINDQIKLKDRSFVCKNCKRLIDRDRNAALNILLEGLKTQTTVGITGLAYLSRKPFPLGNGSSLGSYCIAIAIGVMSLLSIFSLDRLHTFKTIYI